MLLLCVGLCFYLLFPVHSCFWSMLLFASSVVYFAYSHSYLLTGHRASVPDRGCGDCLYPYAIATLGEKKISLCLFDWLLQEILATNLDELEGQLLELENQVEEKDKEADKLKAAINRQDTTLADWETQWSAQCIL